MSYREQKPEDLACYRCGTSLQKLSLPLSRFDLCPSCSVELHVCRMCVHYAPSAPDSCLEEDAPDFRNKTAANFCDFFRPNPNAHDGSEKQAEDKARLALDSLFGSGDAKPGDDAGDPAQQQAEDLFK